MMRSCEIENYIYLITEYSKILMTSLNPWHAISGKEYGKPFMYTQSPS